MMIDKYLLSIQCVRKIKPGQFRVSKLILIHYLLMTILKVFLLVPRQTKLLIVKKDTKQKS